MSLKILILPTLIILDVIITIGYIKPNVDGILAKQIEIQTAKDDLGKVDSIIANIQSIGRSVTGRSEVVSFVEKYYPSVLDEERVVDMFNYLAQQSGIVVNGVDVTMNPEVGASDTTYSDAINSGLTDEEATLMASAAALAAPKSYTTQIRVIGAYDNIKDFFSRIHHADRLHAVEEFSINKREQGTIDAKDDDTAVAQANFLEGTLRAQFPYLGPQRTANALNDPLFQSPNFDFKIAEKAASFVTNPLPMLDAGSTGRANPYE
ncbi:MAG: hypothetical protein WAT81_02680 [Candidatus Moraniibacteriota bacterium]